MVKLRCSRCMDTPLEGVAPATPTLHSVAGATPPAHRRAVLALHGGFPAKRDESGIEGFEMRSRGPQMASAVITERHGATPIGLQFEQFDRPLAALNCS